MEKPDQGARHAPTGSAARDSDGKRGGAGGLLRRWLPLIVLIVVMALVFGLGLDNYLSFSALKMHRAQILGFVAENPALAALAFMLIYAAAVACSLPGGTVLTITGGFLFGRLGATSMVVVAATLGATVLFLIARGSLGAGLHRRAGPWLRQMEAGFQENALSYLLVLRLVPLFPFFIVNLVPAFLGVRTRTYVVATLFGIIPGTFVYASVGVGLGSVFDRGEAFSLQGVLTPQVLGALIGLAVLSLLPIVYKMLKRRGA